MKSKSALSSILEYWTTIILLAIVFIAVLPVLLNRRSQVVPSLVVRQRKAAISLLSHQAGVAAASGDYLRAKGLYDQMLAMGVHPEAIGLYRSEVFEKLGQPRLAYLALKDWVGNDEYSTSQASTDPCSLAKLGEWARKYGYPAEAEEYEHRVILNYNLKLPSGNSAIDEARLNPDQTRATALSLAALEECNKREGIAAVAFARKAVKISPNLAIGQFALGVSMVTAQGSSANLEFGTEPKLCFDRAYALASGQEQRRMQDFLFIHGISTPN